VLSASNLECVRGTRRLFGDVSLEAGRGECLLVTGPNGCGKTSLLRILAGLAQPERGEVRWNGEPARTVSEEFRADLAWCGHLNSLKDDLTPVENLLASSALRGRPASAGRAAAALAALGLPAFGKLPLRALSQGQKRRVALARVLLADCALWILDEPLTSLDEAAAATVAGLLDAHLVAGGVAVIASHQPIPLKHGALHGLELGKAAA
jgi:heme exporter protein A